MADLRSIISETPSTDHAGGSIVDDTDDFELQQRLEKLEHEIANLTSENTAFETILERKKTELTAHHTSSVTAPSSSSPTTSSNSVNHDMTNNNSVTNRSDRLARKRSRSRSTQADFRVQLTLEQKLDFMTSEYESTKNDKFRHEIEHEKGNDQLKSDREWIENEIADFDSAIAEFLKLKDSSIDKRTRKLLGERFVHYFHERLKGRESLMNKLRDCSSGYKRQIVRFDNQIRQNEEMGETLQEIDFSQLKIENKQYLDQIDEKNLELVLLKQQVAMFNKIFNNYKNRLQLQTQTLLDIEKRIDKQQTLLEHTQRELSAVNHEQNRVGRKHSRLVEQSENYRVPEIMDYVRKKALLYNLQRDCEVWQRKVELVSMGFRQSKQQWQAVQQNARYPYHAAN